MAAVRLRFTAEVHGSDTVSRGRQWLTIGKVAAKEVAMADVRIEGDDLVIEPRGWHKVWALRRRLVVPKRAVRGVAIDPDMARRPRGIRLPGTYVPRVITAGTFLHRGERIFWDVRNPERAVVIDFSSGKYARAIVEVDDPERVVAMLGARG
ncbi:hypothetical protein [Nocardia sp. CC201C]|uniref:hypothetical protein n=1 Tax=Nocardia sp. CC201C TaxID=3044575 RepID=UPI0024A7F9D1|nr:hypothetical protein [Nocardia sp. CC201C]